MNSHSFLKLLHFELCTKRLTSILNDTGCLKIREFRIQSVVGKDPVELEKYLEKKFRYS
jgi:hypothetical protein